MKEEEDPELASSEKHTKGITAYSTTHYEKDLKTSITTLHNLRYEEKATLRWA